MAGQLLTAILTHSCQWVSGPRGVLGPKLVKLTTSIVNSTSFLLCSFGISLLFGETLVDDEHLLMSERSTDHDPVARTRFSHLATTHIIPIFKATLRVRCEHAHCIRLYHESPAPEDDGDDDDDDCDEEDHHC